MTTIYALAVDGTNGTECLTFNTDAERVDWIWRNCVEVWRDGEKLEGDDLAAYRAECDDDWTIPVERGQWAEMCTLSFAEHEVKHEPHPAAAFINRMAQFTTPEDEFADPKNRNDVAIYSDVEEYISDMSDDRLTGEYSTFMEMVREARTIRDAAPASSAADPDGLLPGFRVSQDSDRYAAFFIDGETREDSLLDEKYEAHINRALAAFDRADPVRDAAPDMLKVLKRFASVFGENLDDPDEPLNGGDAVDELCKLWPSIKVAILKAEGGAA